MLSSPSLASPYSPLCGLDSPHRRLFRCAAVATSPPSPPDAVAVGARSAMLYDVLGVAAGASGIEIKAAYRRLARACHPDAVPADRRGASADEFMRVHAAYETLSDPDKRAEYDRRVMEAEALAFVAGHRWQPFYASRSYAYSAGRRRRRTWETDQCW